ncbi:MAG: glycosyltransferase family 2 protein [Chloroflexi bacterium]|nr:glycosyltransferase family 2 protein [Chloroflexota bacterium]
MKVTAIVCCYTLDRLDDIHAAVRSMMHQTLPPFEVVVAVDHNRELLARLRQELPASVRIVLNDGLQGLSETRNVASRAATGDVLAFLDDDAVAEPDWLEHLVRPFEDPNVVAVGGHSIPRWEHGGNPRWLPEELYWIVGCSFKGMPMEGDQIRNPLGCSMALRKTALEQAGMFETYIGGIGQRLKGGEEAELSLRMTRRIPGCRIVYAPRSVIHHKVAAWRTNLKWAFTKSYQEGVCKAKVGKFTRGLAAHPLATESSYLRYLLLQAIPARLLRCYQLDALLQVGTILLSITAAGLGYLKERTAKAPNDREAYA